MIVVAVTGGVASGKSAVTRRFEALGATVHDADLIARELVLPQQPALREIVTAFGPGVLAADGSLDRPAMRQRVFADAAQRALLESILHPRIREVLRQRALQPCPAPPTSPMSPPGNATANAQARDGAIARPYVVLAVPLLAESHGDYSWVDRVLVVDVPRAVQHARLLGRDGIDASAADAMIDAQATRTQRLAIADDVIVNDGPLEWLDTAVETVHARYRALGAATDAAA